MTERAYRCGVCRKTYSLAPSNPRWTTKLWHVVRGLIGATCVSLLAFGLAGPPWPHLALLALVILGSRSHGLLAVALLTAGTMVALLHAKGMRLMMHIDDTGRLGLTVVRHGLPIPGVGAGTILVATDELDRSVFRRSVVYIYQHSTSMGSSGVILNQPMHGPPSGGVASNNASIANKTNKTVHPSQNNQKTASPQHFLGGPVGMPGEGARQEIIVLHTVPGVEGAVPLQLPPSASSIKIYMGGRLGDVLELVHESPFKCPSINVYHGISTWAEGQLEGEIRAGAWAYGQGIGDDIISGDTTNLWSSLLTSNRLTWLA